MVAARNFSNMKVRNGVFRLLSTVAQFTRGTPLYQYKAIEMSVTNSSMG